MKLCGKKLVNSKLLDRLNSVDCRIDSLKASSLWIFIKLKETVSIDHTSHGSSLVCWKENKNYAGDIQVKPSGLKVNLLFRGDTFVDVLWALGLRKNQ